MGTTSIGHVRTGKTKKSVEVRWNPTDRKVYVAWASGLTNIGEASSASEAMTKAEAWLYDK